MLGGQFFFREKIGRPPEAGDDVPQSASEDGDPDLGYPTSQGVTVKIVPQPWVPHLPPIFPPDKVVPKSLPW